MKTSPQGIQLLDAKAVALVAIDLQAKLLPAIFEAERVIKNAVILLRLGRMLSIPTILTTQYAQGLGPVVPEVKEVVPDAAPLDKTSFGCFGDAHFRERLQELGRATLLVAGVETHVCVTQTVLGALQAGYVVHVAGDATSSRARENRQAGLHRMEKAGAIISSTEMMVYELLRKSDTPEFKAILPLLK